MTTTMAAPVTARQLDYINDLIDERDCGDQEVLKGQAKGLDKQTASRWITRLKELPKRHSALQTRGKPLTQIKSDVPAGRYAVTGEDGTTDFYRVDRPTEGKWAGYVFVKLQLSDELQRVPLRNTQTILGKIAAAGIQESMERYGREIGHCGHCGRTLTNPESIERGIGPVCAGKMGW